MTGQQTPSNVSTMLGMHTRAAWLVAGAYLFGISCLAIDRVSRGETPLVVAAPALAAIGVSVAVLLLVPGDPLPRWATLVIAAAAVFSVAATTQTPPLVDSVHELWPLHGFIGILVFLCVRGRTISAWLTMTAMVAVAAVWTYRLGHSPVHGILLASSNFAPLAMAAFFAYTIRPSVHRLIALRERRVHEIASHAASDAAVDERNAQLQRLDDTARPLLERIAADPDGLTPGEVAACHNLESRLRESIRARGLLHPDINTAVEAARLRGATVVLFDDNGMDEVTPEIRERVLTALPREIDDAPAGSTITVRVVPPGRDKLVTVVVRGESDSRRCHYDLDGVRVSESR
ncbi:MAG: hypothetical protein QM809_02200 [Gordonia sp. (in: high G+C Gram-positive bacteria)]|uniref:hypothetical protein n=1 Tax=Gordonia sp. (in: high G+C Gram-positive bacteria) TaxID=84139 RepID=UPI0039E402DA